MILRLTGCISLCRCRHVADADMCTGSSSYAIILQHLQQYVESHVISTFSSCPIGQTQCSGSQYGLTSLTMSEVLPKDADESGCPPAASCSFKETNFRGNGISLCGYCQTGFAKIDAYFASNRFAMVYLSLFPRKCGWGTSRFPAPARWQGRTGEMGLGRPGVSWGKWLERLVTGEGPWGKPEIYGVAIENRRTKIP